MNHSIIPNALRAIVLAAAISAGSFLTAEKASAQVVGFGFGGIGAQPYVNPYAFNPYGYYPSAYGYNPYVYNPYAYNVYAYNRALLRYAQITAPFSPQRQFGRTIFANQYNFRNPNNVQYFRGPSGNLQAQGGVIRFPGPNNTGGLQQNRYFNRRR